jgi:hypothetical protein
VVLSSPALQRAAAKQRERAREEVEAVLRELDEEEEYEEGMTSGSDGEGPATAAEGVRGVGGVAVLGWVAGSAFVRRRSLTE